MFVISLNLAFPRFSGGALGVYMGRCGVLRGNGGRALAREQQPPGRRPLAGCPRAQVIQQVQLTHLIRIDGT